MEGAIANQFGGGLLPSVGMPSHAIGDQMAMNLAFAGDGSSISRPAGYSTVGGPVALGGSHVGQDPNSIAWAASSAPSGWTHGGPALGSLGSTTYGVSPATIIPSGSGSVLPPPAQTLSSGYGSRLSRSGVGMASTNRGTMNPIL